MDYEDDEDPIEEALGQAYFEYIGAIGKIIRDLSVEDLKRIKNKIKSYNHVSQTIALREIDLHINLRPSLEHARAIGAEIYCIEHSCDSKDCPDKHEK